MVGAFLRSDTGLSLRKSPEVARGLRQSPGGSDFVSGLRSQYARAAPQEADPRSTDPQPDDN